MKANSDMLKVILEVGKRLDTKKVLNAYEGNVSLRDGEHVYITPSGKNKAYLTEDMIAILELDGTQVGGCFPASSEAKLHLHTYRNREDIRGIAHAHPPFLTAHALCGEPVRTKAYPEMMVLYGSIEVAPYGRPGTDDIYKGVLPLLENGDVILLENHGAMAVGPDLYAAANSLEAAEATAQILTLTKIVGKQKDLSDEECAVLMHLHALRRGQ